MESIKTNKILTVLVLIMVIDIGYANKPRPPLQTFLEEHMSIVGDYPKLDDIFEVVYRIKAIETKDWTQRQEFLSADYVAVIRVTQGAVEIVDKDKLYFSGLSFGEYKEFHFHCRIIKAINIIKIERVLNRVIQGKFYGPITIGGYTSLSLRLIDPQTGQYGTREAEYEGIEYRYEAATFGFMSAPDPTVGELNKKVIAMMRKMEPALSDSEALLLHSEIAQVGAPIGFHPKKFEKGMLPGEEYEEFYKYYLRNGWLKAIREGRYEEWIKDEKSKLEKNVHSNNK